MALPAKLRKALRLLSRPRLGRAALRHGVAAATEHLSVIRHTAAATLIDIGANKGQFSLAFRALRPRGRIIAFEPLPDAAAKFQALFGGDGAVTLHRTAISDREGTAEFHVADRADSSSLLKPGAGQSQAFGVSGAATIRVDVRRLSSCLDVAELARPVLMKIDVQGAELGVLQGCDDLERVDFVYVELSYVELYEGQPLFDTVASYLNRRGFTLAGVFNQANTAAFGPTQADFLFSRDNG